jgi:hypothetical protein
MSRNMAPWIGVFGGPLAWLCSFEARFALAPWACTFQNKLGLYVITLISLLVCGACAGIAWRQWKALGEEGPSEEAGVFPRSVFMAIGGIVLSLASCMILLAQAIPEVILGACE